MWGKSGLKQPSRYFASNKYFFGSISLKTAVKFRIRFQI